MIIGLRLKQAVVVTCHHTLVQFHRAHLASLLTSLLPEWAVTTIGILVNRGVIANINYRNLG